MGPYKHVSIGELEPIRRSVMEGGVRSVGRFLRAVGRKCCSIG